MILSTLRELEEAMIDKDVLAQATDARLAVSQPAVRERAQAVAESLATRAGKGAVKLGEHGRAQLGEPSPQAGGPFTPALARRSDETP